jgi:hypothetical protein
MALVTMHVRREGRRTTVSMEEVLSTLLSLHLGGKVDLGVVARWCQEEIDADPGAYFSNASQRLAGRAALAIAPKNVQEAYYDQMAQGRLAKKLAKPKRRRPKG